MSGVTHDQLLKLQEPFPADDIEWRIGQSGKKNDKVWATALAYVTNRAIQNRLDEVCGPENWKNEFLHRVVGETTSVMCGISIRTNISVEDEFAYGDWVTKWDGAEETDVESVKGGLSAAMKRAAVQWGIGRYLYDLPAGWAQIHDGGKNFAKLKEGGSFKWDPPEIPASFLPANAPAASTPSMSPALAKIKAAYKQIPKDYVTRVEGVEHPLKQWIKDNGTRLETNPELAMQVAKLCEQIE